MPSPIDNLIGGIIKSSLKWKFVNLKILDGYDDHLDYLSSFPDTVYIFTTKIDIDYLMKKANEVLDNFGDSYQHTNDEYVAGAILWNGKFITIPSKVRDSDISMWTRFFGHDDMSECVVCMEIPEKSIGMTMCMICCSVTCSSCVEKIRDDKCPICRTRLDR